MTPEETVLKGQASIFAKMARVMGKLSNLPKNGKNAQQNYQFVKSDDVLDVVRQAMAEERLALMVSVVNSDIQKVEKVTRAIITYAFTLCCGDTGAVVSSQWVGLAEDYSDKAVNKAATAAEKYWLLKTFLVGADDVDPDADSPGLDKGGKEKLKPRTSVQRPAALPAPAHSDDDQPAEPPKPWYQTGALQTLVERARNAGYIEPQQGANDLLALLGNGATWSKFAGAGEAGTAIKAAVEAIKGSAPNNAAPQNAPAPAPQKPAAAGKAELTDISTANVEWATYDGQRIVFRADGAGDNGVARVISCWSRDEFAQMVGEAFAAEWGVRDWHGTKEKVERYDCPVSITYGKNQKGYWTLISATPASPVDDPFADLMDADDKLPLLGANEAKMCAAQNCAILRSLPYKNERAWSKGAVRGGNATDFSHLCGTSSAGRTAKEHSTTAF